MFRLVYGLLLAVSMLRFIAYGWVERFFVTPRFHFKYWGFGWVQPLPAHWMHGLFVALLLLALAVSLGFMFRVSALLFALGLSYVQLIDVTTYLNHYYLAALLAWLLACTPAHRTWSVDAWLMRKWRKVTPAPVVAVGVLYLFRFQVATVYTFAGLAKLQSDWLIHAQPLRIWLGANTHLPVVGPLLTEPWVPLVMSWLGFLFDSTIALWLSWRVTRPFAFLAVIGFHVLTRVLFPIGMFPVIMIASALVFFSPSWPRWRKRTPCVTPVSATMPLTAAPRFGIMLGLCYCGLQLLLPLRCLAYGGNVLWHEQGMRFSWRVMLRAKGGSTTFIARDRSTGQTYHISPRTYLSDLQESEMSSQPDLILQLAHHIERDLAQRARGPFAIYVDARASLNGRHSQPLIDPAIDLTTIDDGWRDAHWVLPAPTQTPPHTRPVL